MNKKKMSEAVREAKRFLAAAKDVEKLIQQDTDSSGWWVFTGTKETGALRRASLDLTRALAELRKSG